MTQTFMEESEATKELKKETYEEKERKQIIYNSYRKELYNRIVESAEAESRNLQALYDLMARLDALSDQELHLELCQLLTKYEQNFLRTRTLASLISRAEERGYEQTMKWYQNSNCTECQGISTDEEADYHLERTEHEWIFHLPPMVGKKQKNRYASDGRWIYYLVTNMLNHYENQYGHYIEAYKKPVMIYLHYTDVNNDLPLVLDADNVDEKVVTDAMQGTLIPDDNLLQLWTLHIGIPGEKTCTKIYVMDQSYFPDWIEQNKKLFKNVSSKDVN